jgi:hypothetical protein
VKAKIRKHNKDVLHLPTWHKEEIRALGGNLKRMVAYGSLQQAKAKRRIDFETVAYLVQIDKDERFLRYAGYIPQDCFSVEDVFEPSATVNKPTIKKQKAAPVVIEKKKEKVKTVRELQEGEVKHNYVGVIFSKGEYRAGIYEDGSRKIIGSFKTPQEALEARRAYLKLDISSASLYYDR